MFVRLGRGGEAGIGVGVILIALILTSATAASAILSAINDSAERAQAAASDAILEIATGLTIKEVRGMAQDGVVVSLQVLIVLQPGSPPIRLDSLIISMVTSRESVLLDASAHYACEVLSPGGENDILERGEIAKLELVLPSSIGAGERLLFSVFLSQGQTATEHINIPETITNGPIILY